VGLSGHLVPWPGAHADVDTNDVTDRAALAIDTVVAELSLLEAVFPACWLVGDRTEFDHRLRPVCFAAHGPKQTLARTIRRPRALTNSRDQNIRAELNKSRVDNR
jgi:hypothetical protein